MKQKQRFTLIEILTVIAVIGILAGCIFPALLAVQNNSRRTKTETILTGVNTALRVFKGDYNLLPTLGGSVPECVGEWTGNIDSMKPNDDYYTFFDILTYKNYQGRGSGINNVSSAVSEVNTKAKQYLDPPKEYFSSDETRTASVTVGIVRSKCIWTMMPMALWRRKETHTPGIPFLFLWEIRKKKRRVRLTRAFIS